MKKITVDPTNIEGALIREVASVIKSGGIVALPTETVYGLAASTSIKGAVERLYAIKKRTPDKPFTLALDSVEKVMYDYFSVLPPFGFRLIEKFWPGPLTIIYYSRHNEKVGIRVPSHVVISEILKEVNGPVYLPSANISGEKEAVSAAEVDRAFGNTIDLIVDGGNSLYAKPSTVIDLTYHPFKILREGVVTEREVIDVFIRKRILFICTGNTCRSPLAQFLFKKYLEEAKPYLKNRYEIISRGVASLEGMPASAYVVSILKENDNIDARNFTSKRLDRRTLLSSDLIFTMEDAQSQYILNLEPSAENRVFNLKKFLPPDLEKDISDPMGKSYDVYQEVYSLIKQAILELKDWL